LPSFKKTLHYYFRHDFIEVYVLCPHLQEKNFLALKFEKKTLTENDTTKETTENKVKLNEPVFSGSLE